MSEKDEYKGHNIIFIVGCSRSGTTWLQRLLACHSQIRTGQETHLFPGYIGPLLHTFNVQLDQQLRGNGIGMGCYFTQEEFYMVLKSFMFTLLKPALKPLKTGEFFLEKTPGHALYLQEIMRFLPECKIIHLVRDARDVVASLLAASRSWGTNWAPKSAREAALKWVKYVQTVRIAQGIIPQRQFFEVRYEELCKQPNRILTNCFAFLGLECDENEIQLAIEKNNPRNPNFSGAGTSIPLGGEAKRRYGMNSVKEPQGFIRKVQSGNWRQYLSIKEKYYVWRICRKLMAKEGYQWPFFLFT